MRYVRKEHVITTICNEDVDDNDNINSVLNNLKDNMVEFSLSVRKYFPSLGNHKDTNYSKVRVKNVSGDNADFMIFDKSSTTHLKGVEFNNIVEIHAITTVDKILKTKPDATRWDFLDITED